MTNAKIYLPRLTREELNARRDRVRANFALADKKFTPEEYALCINYACGAVGHLARSTEKRVFISLEREAKAFYSLFGELVTPEGDTEKWDAYNVAQAKNLPYESVRDFIQEAALAMWEYKCSHENNCADYFSTLDEANKQYLEAINILDTAHIAKAKSACYEALDKAIALTYPQASMTVRKNTGERVERTRLYYERICWLADNTGEDGDEYEIEDVTQDIAHVIDKLDNLGVIENVLKVLTAKEKLALKYKVGGYTAKQTYECLRAKALDYTRKTGKKRTASFRNTAQVENALKSMRNKARTLYPYIEY